MMKSLRRRDVDGSRQVSHRQRGTRLITQSKLKFDPDALDLGQTLGTIKRKEGLLNLPPGKVGLFGLRETFEYLRDPNAFIKTRVQKYGPVFKTGFFFKPAIVFGSREAVEEFRQFEGILPADAALPETFRELHTAYGALRQSGDEHAATRANFSKVLGRSALEKYTPLLAKMTKEFVLGELVVGGCGTSGGMQTKDKEDSMTKQSETNKCKLQPGYDLRQFCLKSLFQLFIGVVPPEELMNEMYAYNEGLLALGKLSPEFEDGQKALEKLTSYVEKHYRTIKAQGKLDEDKYYFFSQYSTATDEFGVSFTDERIATTCVLMIWGAYIEAAANMGHCLWTLMRNRDKLEVMRKECRDIFSSSDLKTANPDAFTLTKIFTSLKYTEAVVKETLRVVPQTAGGLRVNSELRQLAGFDIPEGYVLTADPRVAFMDPTNFPEPEEFVPERFLSDDDARKKKAFSMDRSLEISGLEQSPDAYFPGGVGQHKCPGLSLSTLMTQVFLVYVSGVFDKWEPDLSDEGTPDPEYIQIPIVIIDDKYRLEFERSWQFDM